MTLQQLRYFLATADQGSFSAAAEELRLAQPSVSEQVRLLEAELGVALFVRAGRDAHADRGRARRCAGTPAAILRRRRGGPHGGRRGAAGADGTVTLGVFGTASYYFVGEVIEGVPPAASGRPRAAGR